VAAVAGFRRHWALFALALVVVSCDVAWEGPVLWPFPRAPAPVPGAAPWQLFDANIAQDNYRPREIAREIAVDHPDVVALEELTPQAYRWLTADGVLADYRWDLVEPRSGAGGMGLWARVPMNGYRSWVSDGSQVELAAWVAPPHEPRTRLDVVHVYAPAEGPDEPAEWRGQLAQVRDHLRREPRPLVVAGDFNATADAGPFQRILHLGLSDAAVLAGQGWRMTWPRNQPWVVPYLRIDHVLLSPGLTETAYRLGDGQGSDHHPVIVEIASTGDHR
jgi:endonuclease/exonuclease/phosphatase (EEP) superfamily protein YafD